MPDKPLWKRVAGRLLHGGMPVPGVVRPAVRGLYRAGFMAGELVRLVYAWFVVVPVMRSVAEVGPGLRIERIPYIWGRGHIRIGTDVYISGKLGLLFASRGGDLPVLTVGDRTFIGHDCQFSTARRISIGNDCLVAAGTRLQDNDGHPLELERRLKREPVAEEEIEPITIEDGVWIAPRCTINKGVTIGRGAVVGTGAIVTRDVPPGTLVAGNPARVIRELHHEGTKSTKEE